MAENDYPLHVAVETGEYLEVCNLIKTGKDINEPDTNGLTPLHTAVKHGHTDVVKFLLEHGANTEVIENEELLYPIHLAARYGHLPIVELLLKHGADLNTRTEYTKQPIHFAAEEGHVDIIQCLLDNGVDIEALTERKSTPLHRAVSSCQVDAVEYLLKRKANVNKRTDMFYTPLHFAAVEGNTEILELLIKVGAKINEKNYFGWAPIHLASMYGHADTVKILFEVGAKCAIRGVAKSLTPLHLACRTGHLDVVKYFFQKGADIELQTKMGYTLLHTAAQNGQTDIVGFLIENGADIECKTRPKGCTPLYFATRYCYPDIVDLLIQEGACFETNQKHLGALDLIPLEFEFDLNDEDRILYKECAQVIIKYMVLCNKSQTPLLTEDYPYSKELTDFWHDCQKEIEDMKQCIIFNTTISLYTFLRYIFDDHKLAICLYNENLLEELKDIEKYIKQFQIYANIAHMIKNKVKGAMKRQFLLEKADLVIDMIISELPLHCRWKLCSYLNNEDLNNFVQLADN